MSVLPYMYINHESYLKPVDYNVKVLMLEQEALECFYAVRVWLLYVN